MSMVDSISDMVILIFMSFESTLVLPLSKLGLPTLRQVGQKKERDGRSNFDSGLHNKNADSKTT